MVRGSNGWHSAKAVVVLSMLALAAACDGSSREDGGDDDPSGIVIGGDDSSGGSDGSDGSDGSSGGDGSGSGAGDEGSLSCGEHDIVTDVAVPQVMLVLDKSNSMVSNRWDADGDPATPRVTRWQSLHEVVEGLVGAFDQSVQFGAVMFPSVSLTDTDPATACTVPDAPDVAIGLGHGDAILAAMPAADSTAIYGGTPTTAGFLTGLDSLLGAADGNPQAIVLVTDGAANCMDGVPQNQVFSVYDDDLEPAVADAFESERIPTYVVGIDIVDEVVDVPHTNPWERLSEVAIAGGVAREGAEKFYNANDQIELDAALREITGAIQCQVTLDRLPSASDRVHLVVGGAEVPYSADCSDTGGWRYVDGDTIELCTAACGDFVTAGSLHAGYDCIPEG